MTLDAFLEEVYGDHEGKAHRLFPGLVGLGRSDQADIKLDQESVSRCHAEITSQGDQYFVRDSGSMNGTFVNDVPVGEHELRHGDFLKVGRTIFRFILRPVTDDGSAGPVSGPAGSSPPSSTAPAWLTLKRPS